MDTRPRNPRLVPRHAFAIQIKSSPEIFDVTNKREYLSDLDVPYFVGVIDREDPALTFYSGEFIPLFFAKEGVPPRMRIRLVDEDIGSEDAAYVQKYGQGGRRLVCPKLLRLPAHAEQSVLDEAVRKLQERCVLIQTNIAARRSAEHVYRVRDSAVVRTMAGSGSAEVFRGNLYLRLAEVFANFWWLAENRPDSVDKREWLIYQELHAQLRKYGVVELPEYVERLYSKAEPAVRALWREGAM